MLFSIIIPVYNEEHSLQKCLESIFSQSIRDYEVIVVDDGSIDASPAVVSDMKKRYPSVQYCRISHSGAGAARNKGLSMATGKYVLFLDADDYWLDAGLLEALADKIAQHETDVFMFRMCKLKEDGTVLNRYRKPPFRYDNIVMTLQDVYADLVQDGQALATACNKCIRRQLLLEHNITFREDILAEDIDWVLQLFTCIESICLINVEAYAYTQHRYTSRSTQKAAPNDLADTIMEWSQRLKKEYIPCASAVAGLIAFEYGICMGNNHLLSSERRAAMKQQAYLLDFGLDRKTRLICRVYRIFGYSVTCRMIWLYLSLRRIW